MSDRFRDLILRIAVIGSFTISLVEPSVRLPAMFFVFLGVTVMVLRWRRRNPGPRDPKANQQSDGGTA